MLEVVLKPHLISDSCVACLFKMLTYYLYAALFHRHALVELHILYKNRCEIPLSSGAIKHDLRF